jgi:hypothetical protein
MGVEGSVTGGADSMTAGEVVAASVGDDVAALRREEVSVGRTRAMTPADRMIALHAWHSSDSIRDFREHYPDRPLIVVLSGTDIYYYIDRDPAPTSAGLKWSSPDRDFAWRLSLL